MNSISNALSDCVSDFNMSVTNGASALKNGVRSTMDGIDTNVGELLENDGVPVKAQRALGLVE